MDFFIIQNSDDTFLEPPPDSFLLLLLPRLQWEREIPHLFIRAVYQATKSTSKEGSQTVSQPAVFFPMAVAQADKHTHTLLSPGSSLLGRARGFQATGSCLCSLISVVEVIGMPCAEMVSVVTSAATSSDPRKGSRGVCGDGGVGYRRVFFFNQSLSLSLSPPATSASSFT